MGHLKDELKEKRTYGGKISFKKDDGLWRFRGANCGLWRLYSDNAYNGKDKDGVPKLKNGWGSNGEIIGEGEDMHFVTTNGIKVFMFPKPEKK